MAEHGGKAKKPSRKKLKLKIKPLYIAIAAIVVILLIAFLPGIFNAGKLGTTVSEASLKNAVSISKLSTAEFTYEGIAEKMDDKDRVVYHIYYKASADAGMNLEEIDFKIDNENKTVTPILPEMTISNPVIDESVFEFLPRDANVNMKEVIKICKADAANEINDTPMIKEIALRNMRSTIEALLVPILKESGMQIAWDSSDNSADKAQSDSQDQQDGQAANGDSENAKGDGNEDAQ